MRYVRTLTIVFALALAAGWFYWPSMTGEPQNTVTAQSPPSQSFKDCDICPEMVPIPPGEFLMGSPEPSGKKCDPTVSFNSADELRQPNEGPQHKVTIGYKFALGKYEVTTGEWDACVADGVCRGLPDWQRKGFNNLYFDGKGPDFEITARVPAPVSWNEVTTQYLPWLQKKTGKKYRLPSEAEWEYAMRGGTTTPFWSGCYAESGAHTSESLRFYGKRVLPSEVGKLDPNPFGLYDMQSSFWELVQDCYHETYQGAPADGSAWTTPCTQNATDSIRVLRGGQVGSFWLQLRSAARDQMNAAQFGGWVGFRLALTQ